MKPIAIKFGGYQKPASIHNRAAARFGELLKQRLGDRVAFELIGSVLDLGRPSGDLPVMVETGELSFCSPLRRGPDDLQGGALPGLAAGGARRGGRSSA